MKFNLLSLSFLLLISLTFSCNKEDDPITPSNSSTPQTKTPTDNAANENVGDISGEVDLFQLDFSQFSDESGVTVALELEGKQVASTETNASGEFRFEDVALNDFFNDNKNDDRYYLVISKENFGTYRKDVIHSEKDGTVVNNGNKIELSPKSDISIDHVDGIFDQLGQLELYIRTSNTNSEITRGKIKFLLSTSADLDTNNFEDNHSREATKVNGGDEQFLLNMDDYSSGDTVYLLIYGDSPKSNTYVDENERLVFPNLNDEGKSNRIKLVIP